MLKNHLRRRYVLPPEGYTLKIYSILSILVAMYVTIKEFGVLQFHVKDSFSLHYEKYEKRHSKRNLRLEWRKKLRNLRLSHRQFKKFLRLKKGKK